MARLPENKISAIVACHNMVEIVQGNSWDASRQWFPMHISLLNIFGTVPTDLA